MAGLLSELNQLRLLSVDLGFLSQQQVNWKSIDMLAKNTLLHAETQPWVQ